MFSSTIKSRSALTLMSAFLAFIAISAMAAPFARSGARPPLPSSTLLVCIVPNEDARQSQVALRIATAPAMGLEVVTATLVERGQSTVMVIQAAATEISAALKKGEFASVLLKEDFSLGNGVMLSAGFIAITPGQDQLEGFLAANDSVYPLSCKFP